MKILLSRLRKIIQEEIARNYHTLDNDPYSYMDYPGTEINLYASPEVDGWYAQVTCEFDDSLSTPLRVFSSEADAESFARREAEKINRVRMTRGIDTETVDSRYY